jgi:hypothetical protein
LFSLSSIQILAQSLEQKKGSLEKFFFAGPNIGFLRGNYFNTDSDQYQRPKVGFTVGVGTSYQLKKNLDFSALIMLEEKGAKQYFSVNSGKINAEIEYTYRNYTLGLLTVYRFGANRKLGIGLGPFISYLNKLTTNEFYYFPPQYFHLDQTNNNVDWEFGLSLQCDYQIKIGNNLSLDLRLLNQFGLTNTRDVTQYPVYVEVKTNAISFLMGVTYKFNKY